MERCCVSCRGIGKRFDEQWVLRNVDLRCHGGECLAVLGPSGSGKTTLLNIVSGVHRCDCGELWRRLATTLWRMALGWGIGSVVGIVLGLVAGRFEPVYDALRPTQSLLLGVPPVVLVVVAMIWFGSGSLVPIAVVSVLIFPIVYVNTAQGWRSLDLRLVEMARIYGKGSGEVLRHVILPGLAVPIFTGLSVSAGFAVRISVMAELLASDSGIGYSIALARVNINTAKVFAWALVSVVLVAVIDVLIVNPLKRRALRWQG